MMWRLPRDATRSLEYARFPCKYPPSEEELCKALTAQYHSTYRCDFMGMPQGGTILLVWVIWKHVRTAELKTFKHSSMSRPNHPYSIFLTTVYLSFVDWQDTITLITQKEDLHLCTADAMCRSLLIQRRGTIIDSQNKNLHCWANTLITAATQILTRPVVV